METVRKVKKEKNRRKKSAFFVFTFFKTTTCKKLTKIIYGREEMRFFS